MSVIEMTALDLKGKRVLIRSDLNVPVKDGKVTSDARITASMATINFALDAGARVMVTSHLGRPEEGVIQKKTRSSRVADVIAAKRGKPVRLIKDWVDGGFEVAEGELVLLENCRFNKGEKKNLDETSKKYAALCDIFVMDAFGTAPPRRSIHTWGGEICAGRVRRNSAYRGIGRTNQSAAQPSPSDGCHCWGFKSIYQADRAGIIV